MPHRFHIDIVLSRKNLLKGIVLVGLSTLIFRSLVIFDNTRTLRYNQSSTKSIFRSSPALQNTGDTVPAGIGHVDSIGNRVHKDNNTHGEKVHIEKTKTTPPRRTRGPQTSRPEIYTPAQVHTNTLPPCPSRISGLGPFELVLNLTETEKEIEAQNKNVFTGGRWRPSNCTARHRVAILIPYRNRHTQLWTFLQNIHTFLQTQYIDYGIYVINQARDTLFNRAKLFNIGFKEALKEYDWQCFIFHDVDLLPLNTRNIYDCPHQPRHMSVAIDVFGYKLRYEGQFGGVAAMTTDHFRKINGYSNAFFGWGGEDDDIAVRIDHAHLHRIRYHPNISRYIMISHKKDTPDNRNGMYLLHHAVARIPVDGLHNVTYTLIEKQYLPLYTNISVSFGNDQQEYIKEIKRKRLKYKYWKSNHYVKQIVYDTIDW